MQYWINLIGVPYDHLFPIATEAEQLGFAGLARPGIIAHENVLNRMSASTPPTPAAAQPTTTYYQPTMDMFTNGESIVISHAPAAHTDSDSLVYFRRIEAAFADVI